MAYVNIELTELQGKLVLAQTSVESELEVPIIENPAYVKVSTGITKNMGNFNSLKVEVSVSVPCHVTRIEETEAAVREFVTATTKSLLTKKES